VQITPVDCSLFSYNKLLSIDRDVMMCYLQKGDIVVVRRTTVGEGWCEGEINGKRGLFPSSFVKMVRDLISV